MAGPTAIAAPAAATTPSSRSPCRSRPCPARACWPRTGSHAAPWSRRLKAAQQLALSSLHVTFCTAEEAEALRARPASWSGAAIQYHWENRGYGSFDDFLKSCAAPRRKMVRKEREQVRAAGLELRALHGRRP